MWGPNLFTQLWAAGRAEQALKLRAWCPYLMWILHKRGPTRSSTLLTTRPQANKCVTEGEETAEGESGSDIIQEMISTAADANIAEETKRVYEIDSTEEMDEE